MSESPLDAAWHTACRPDAEIHYLDSGGDGPPLILLHGLAGHAGEWLGTMRHLVPGWRAIALDQRGHGRSTRHPHDLSRDAFADDVAAVITAAALATPVVLVGQSMGAHTAFVTASRHPELVSHLVMVEGGVGGGGIAQLEKLRAALSNWPVPFQDHKTAMDYFGSDNAMGRTWADGLEQRPDGLWPRWDVDVMLRIMEPIFTDELWPEWEALSQPTLLVLGEQGWIDPGQIERMRAVRPAVRYVTIANAGHDLHLEQPDAWLKALDDFLNSNAP